MLSSIDLTSSLAAGPGESKKQGDLKTFSPATDFTLASSFKSPQWTYTTSILTETQEMEKTLYTCKQSVAELAAEPKSVTTQLLHNVGASYLH